jgi:hypothetical protein
VLTVCAGDVLQGLDLLNMNAQVQFAECELSSDAVLCVLKC